MKKIHFAIACLILITAMLTFGVTGCTPQNNDGKTRVALLVNGYLGDKSFFDSANEGLKLIQAEYGDDVVCKAIELGNDSTKFRSYVDDACENYDVIIMGTWQMSAQLSYACVKYPDKKFILFDFAADFSNGKGAKNVYSFEFKQNQVSFLGGVLAAYTIKDQTSFPLSSGSKTLGFVGGADSPIIKDFLVGFIEGAKYIDSDIKIRADYINTFLDPIKGLESAKILYNSCDLVFAAASQAGLGALDAAKDKNKYYLGCDSDQKAMFAEDSSKSSKIVGSVLKRVDLALLDAFNQLMAGTLEYGSNSRLGFNGGYVDLGGYADYVPQYILDEINAIKSKIISGEILVTSAIGTDSSIVDGIITAAR